MDNYNHNYNGNYNDSEDGFQPIFTTPTRRPPSVTFSPSVPIGLRSVPYFHFLLGCWNRENARRIFPFPDSKNGDGNNFRFRSVQF